jgi:hypothetical protein
MRRGMLVISVQNLIYSGFIFIEMLSKREWIYAKGLLLIVFLHLAFIAANALGYSTKYSLKLTVITFTLFYSLQQTFWWLFSLF